MVDHQRRAPSCSPIVPVAMRRLATISGTLRAQRDRDHVARLERHQLRQRQLGPRQHAAHRQPHIFERLGQAEAPLGIAGGAALVMHLGGEQRLIGPQRAERIEDRDRRRLPCRRRDREALQHHRLVRAHQAGISGIGLARGERRGQHRDLAPHLDEHLDDPVGKAAEQPLLGGREFARLRFRRQCRRRRRKHRPARSTNSGSIASSMPLFSGRRR